MSPETHTDPTRTTNGEDVTNTDPNTTPFQPPILTLKNDITIRPYHPTDIYALAHHANNRKIWLNLQNRFPHPYSPANATWWISNCGTLPTTPGQPFIPSDYAICHNNNPIGCIGLEPDEKQSHVMNLGYWIGEEYWGRGVVSEAASMFLRWAFETFPWLVRLAANAYSWNPASIRILEKIGMTREGRLKMAMCKDGKFVDVVLFGIVREGFTGVAVERPEMNAQK